MQIIATGMVCSVGLNAAAACAAMRARIAKFDETPLVSDAGEAVVAAIVPTLSVDVGYRERLVELLTLAVEDCCSDGGGLPADPIPVLVGLPEATRPGVDPEFGSTILEELSSRLGLRLHPRLSSTIAKGHTAGFEALNVARQLIRAGSASSCLIAGVDSYLNPRSLSWLERHGRLKSADNSDGVIPGEAGAAVLVRSATPGSKGLAEVIGIGFGQEDVTVLSEEPLLGLGLAAAARNAFAEAGIAMHEVHFRLSDATGESYGFKELALVEARLVRARCEELPILHCADSIGDIGAAAGVAQLVVSSIAFRKEYAPGPRAVCFTSAVAGERACVILARGS
jgi:3-oxoacyl-[acyl-carrier-protein] synthase-1